MIAIIKNCKTIVELVPIFLSSINPARAPVLIFRLTQKSTMRANTHEKRKLTKFSFKQSTQNVDPQYEYNLQQILLSKTQSAWICLSTLLYHLRSVAKWEFCLAKVFLVSKECLKKKTFNSARHHLILFRHECRIYKYVHRTKLNDLIMEIIILSVWK